MFGRVNLDYKTDDEEDENFYDLNRGNIWRWRHKFKQSMMDPENTKFIDKYIDNLQKGVVYKSPVYKGELMHMFNDDVFNSAILTERLIRILDCFLDNKFLSHAHQLFIIRKLIKFKKYYIAEYVVVKGQIKFSRKQIIQLYNYKHFDIYPLTCIVELPKDVMILRGKYCDVCDGSNIKDLRRQTDHIFAKKVEKTIGTMSDKVCSKYVEKCLKKQCVQTLLILLENKKVNRKCIDIENVVGIYVKKSDKVRRHMRWRRRFNSSRITMKKMCNDTKTNEMYICKLIDTLNKQKIKIVIKHLKQISYALISNGYFQTLFAILNLWKGQPPSIPHIEEYLVKNDDVDILKKAIEFNIITVEQMHKTWRHVLGNCICECKNNIVKYLVEELKIKPKFTKGCYITKYIGYNNLIKTCIKYDIPIPISIYAMSIVKNDKSTSKYCEQYLKMTKDKNVMSYIKKMSPSKYVKILHENGKSATSIIKKLCSDRRSHYYFKKVIVSIISKIISFDKKFTMTDKNANLILQCAERFGNTDIGNRFGDNDGFIRAVKKKFDDKVSNGLMDYECEKILNIIMNGKNKKLFELFAEYKHINNDVKLQILTIIFERTSITLSDIVIILEKLNITKETFMNADVVLFKYISHNIMVELIKFISLPDEFIINYIYIINEPTIFIKKTENIINYKTLITPYVFNAIILSYHGHKNLVSTILKITNLKVSPTSTKCLMVAHLKRLIRFNNDGLNIDDFTISVMKLMLKENNTVEKDLYEIYNNKYNIERLDIKVNIVDNVPFDNDEPASYMHDYNTVIHKYKNGKDGKDDYDKEYEKIINDKLDDSTGSTVSDFSHYDF